MSTYTRHHYHLTATEGNTRYYRFTTHEKGKWSLTHELKVFPLNATKQGENHLWQVQLKTHSNWPSSEKPLTLIPIRGIPRTAFARRLVLNDQTKPNLLIIHRSPDWKELVIDTFNFYPNTMEIRKVIQNHAHAGAVNHH